MCKTGYKQKRNVRVCLSVCGYLTHNSGKNTIPLVNGHYERI